jgi:hypothetical protein
MCSSTSCHIYGPQFHSPCHESYVHLSNPHHVAAYISLPLAMCCIYVSLPLAMCCVYVSLPLAMCCVYVSLPLAMCCVYVSLPLAMWLLTYPYP